MARRLSVGDAAGHFTVGVAHYLLGKIFFATRVDDRRMADALVFPFSRRLYLLAPSATATSTRRGVVVGGRGDIGDEEDTRHENDHTRDVDEASL